MLIPKEEFHGLENGVNLCAGGETPMLKTHSVAIDRFMQDKAQGEKARHLFHQMFEKTRLQCSSLLNVPASDLTFLSSASEGINVVAYGLNWQPGDNVVVADVEFPSGLYPWSVLQEKGVEVRIVRHRGWKVEIDDIAALMDERTRVVLMSHVSMYTGQRIDLPKLSAMVRSRNAALVLDATHAVGVVPVDASLADVLVTSCYKWMLGVHGSAVFYWNRKTLPELQTPFLGWDSAASSGGWQDPLSMTLHEDANRFKAGNPSYISLYVLNNALNHLLPLGGNAIEQHALALTEQLHAGVTALGFDVMTPSLASERAGNVCISGTQIAETAASLAAHNVHVWGTYGVAGRLRISAHVYNSERDIAACLDALAVVKS